jgi:hypothetical protein
VWLSQWFQTPRHIPSCGVYAMIARVLTRRIVRRPAVAVQRSRDTRHPLAATTTRAGNPRRRRSSSEMAPRTMPRSRPAVGRTIRRRSGGTHRPIGNNRWPSMAGMTRHCARETCTRSRPASRSTMTAHGRQHTAQSSTSMPVVSGSTYRSTHSRQYGQRTRTVSSTRIWSCVRAETSPPAGRRFVTTL